MIVWRCVVLCQGEERLIEVEATPASAVLLHACRDATPVLVNGERVTIVGVEQIALPEGMFPGDQGATIAIAPPEAE